MYMTYVKFIYNYIFHPNIYMFLFLFFIEILQKHPDVITSMLDTVFKIIYLLTYFDFYNKHLPNKVFFSWPRIFDDPSNKLMDIQCRMLEAIEAQPITCSQSTRFGPLPRQPKAVKIQPAAMPTINLCSTPDRCVCFRTASSFRLILRLQQKRV